MKVSEFALKNKFNNNDKNIVEKLHKDEDRTEEEWFNLFNGQINFDTSSYTSKKKAKEKIEELKSKKQSESNKNK